MKPITTLVADDEPAARNALVHLLERHREIEIVGQSGGGREAVQVIRELRPELAFLDIQMPGLDGFGVVRETDPNHLPIIVFVTAYDTHALHAFEVHAIDYLLKPFSDVRFLEALTVAKGHVQQRRLGELYYQVAALVSAYPRPTIDDGGAAEVSLDAKTHHLDRLLIRVDGSIASVRASDIDWIDADGDSVCVRVGKVSYPLRSTMEKLEGELDPTRFVRIHRSTIVNVERIKELRPCYPGEYVAVLHDGATLKVSRHRRDVLESRLGRKV